MIQLDYCFLVDKLPPPSGEPTADEKVTKEVARATVLSAVDVTTGMTMAAVVKNKGSNNYAITELHRFILECGRSRGVLQSDQEVAIRALLRDAATRIGMTTRLSPAYSHQSQGTAERWHRELWGLVKVFKEMVKTNYKIDQTPATSPLMTWMVKHASWLHNRYQLHTDGKTSYERRWMEPYTKHICEFGETVLFNYSAGVPDKTTASWDYVIWLGRCTQSDEHFVATKQNVHHQRDTMQHY